MALHSDHSLADWSVWAVDLGPSPVTTLNSLSNWSRLPTFDRAGSVRSRNSLPARIAAGLTESDALSCVAFGARLGAVLEARTYGRGNVGILASIDLAGLWADVAHDDYVEPTPSDQLVDSIETEIGYRLPDAYLALAHVRNGGLLARGTHPTTEPTGWASDHIAVTGLYAIGRTSPYSLGGELGTIFMRDEWGYPDWGIGIADTPTAGHEQVMLDYRDCGPTGEPRIVHVDQEAGYRVTVIAPDFASFVRGLVAEDAGDPPTG